MARLKAANLRQTTLAQDCPSNATIISVSSSSGFPQPPFRIFVGTNQDFEIMEVTNVNNNTWTVLRAQEGTTAKAWPAGTRVENRFTAGYYSELVSQDELTWDNISNKPSTFPPSSHAQSHRPSGNDPLAAQDILALDCEYTSRTIYVDSQYGSDTTGNGSESAPFKTFSKAISTVRQAIADGVTITIILKGRGPSYPYSLGMFGRVCIGSGKLVIRGELSTLGSGNVTSGTATTITDSSKSWQPNQWAGKLVCLSRGTSVYWRIIESNTNDTLTVIGRLEITPSSGDTYTIYDWNTYLSGGCVLQGGKIEFFDLAHTSVAGIRAFRIGEPGSYSYNRCYVSFAGNQSSGWFIATPGALLQVFECILNGNGYSYYGIYSIGGVGGKLQVRRSLIRNCAWNAIWAGGAGMQAEINYGTILEGGSSVFRLDYMGFALFWSDVVNGAVDKVTIRNGVTYGLRVEGGSGCRYSGPGYVNYSGNGTDRSADATSYSWYTDA